MTNTLIRLDIFTGTKQIATTTQQIHIMNEDRTLQNIYQYFNMKQPVMLSLLKSGTTFKYNVVLIYTSAHFLCLSVYKI